MSDDIGAGLPFGAKVRSQGRTIGEGEFALLSDLTWTTGEIHSNKEYMAGTPFGERLLGGPIVVAVVASLAALSPMNQRLHGEHGVRTIAALGIEADYRKPVFPGDTLWAETEVVAVRASKSRPGQGVLTMKDTGYNQRDEVVAEVTRTLLIERDLAGAAH